jgi:ribosomal protein S18 acetylase RimI-like enzyme
MIRFAEEKDLSRLQDIERKAGLVFSSVGMEAIADDEPPSLQTLRRYRREGCVWIAVNDENKPVAYVLVDVIDGHTHIEQLSVDPDYARRGIGKELIEYVAQRAIKRGESEITLTTFSDVPWNAPYYRRLGFKDISNRELTPRLREIRSQEALHGLDQWPRVAMQRRLTSNN